VISLDHLWMLAAALVIDAAIGDPELIWRRVPHPVAAMGAAIAWLDRRLNRPALPGWARRILGGLTMVILVAVAGAVGFGLEWLFRQTQLGAVATVLVAAILLAGRSLHDHVAAVADAFTAGGLPAARTAVARIVGRDPAALDEAGVCRAAIESVAENFSDGVVAPALWFAIAGLPGLIAYKAINTADSMIGHLTPRHQAFGWTAARLDDLANLPMSRIAGSLVALAAPAAHGSIRVAFRTMLSDAPRHRSPNAGWPEAAMAATLGLALAGPRRYRGVLIDDPFLNPGGRRKAAPGDIRLSLRVYLAAWALLALAIVVAAVPVVVFA
jgi:adenosylcobinamide-phosphate synthase